MMNSVRTWSYLQMSVQVCTYQYILPVIDVKSQNIWILARYDIVRLRCRTYTLRHRTADIRCRVQHRTYDIVRTILHTILHVRHRSFVNIVGATYDIVRATYDIVGSSSGKSMSYTMSYVSQNLRCRTFENVYRIRCRRCLSYTMSYVFAQTYDVVCFVRYRINLLFRPKPTI